MKTYTTQGTCSRAIEYEVADGVLTACRFVGGCPGNTQGVAKLAVGRKVEDVIAYAEQQQDWEELERLKEQLSKLMEEV